MIKEREMCFEMILKKITFWALRFLNTFWNAILKSLSRCAEKCEKSNGLRIAAVICTSVIAFLCFFLMLQGYALVSDDFIYQNIMGTDQKVQSISDIFYSQYLHYFSWGGRSVAHFIVQFLLLIGKPWSSLLTAGLCIAFCAVCAKLVAGGKKISITCYIAFLALIRLANPNLSDTVLWITGAGNYLYTLFFCIAFLRPFISLLDDADNGSTAIKALGMFILGVFAGWSNENTGISIIVVLSGLLLLRWAYKGLRAPAWSICGLAGAAIGFVIMLFAPGNGQRNQLILDMYGSLPKIVLHRGYMMERALFNYLWPTAMAVSVIVLYMLYVKKERLHDSEICYLLLAAASYIVMVASPTYPDRVAFSTVIFALLAGVSIAWRQASKNLAAKRIFQFAAAFAFAAFAMQSITDVLLPYFQV